MEYLAITKVQGCYSLVWCCRHKLLSSLGLVKARCQGRRGTYVVCFLPGARQLFHLRTQSGIPVNCCRIQQKVRNQDLEANHPPGVDRLQRDTASWKGNAGRAWHLKGMVTGKFWKRQHGVRIRPLSTVWSLLTFLYMFVNTHTGKYSGSFWHKWDCAIHVFYLFTY